MVPNIQKCRKQPGYFWNGTQDGELTVILDVLGHVVIDHVLYIREVEAFTRHVCRHQYILLALAELVYRLGSFLLICSGGSTVSVKRTTPHIAHPDNLRTVDTQYIKVVHAQLPIAQSLEASIATASQTPRNHCCSHFNLASYYLANSTSEIPFGNEDV